MRIDGKKLASVAKEKGIAPEALAQSVERSGLTGDRALSAVRNWMRGTDHPRCRAEDIKRLATALGVEPSKIAKFQCILKYHRGSPRKVQLLVDLIRGKDFDTALDLLTFTTKRAAVDVKKALVSAYDAADKAEAELSSLIVSESMAQEGPTLKRFQQKDRGRAHSIHKRMTHITVSLSEKA